MRERVGQDAHIVIDTGRLVHVRLGHNSFYDEVMPANYCTRIWRLPRPRRTDTACGC